MQSRWRSFKRIVRLWVDLFDRHSLLTYASAIALRAAVACTLFALGLLGAFVRVDLHRLRNKQVLLPLVAGVIRG